MKTLLTVHPIVYVLGGALLLLHAVALVWFLLDIHALRQRPRRTGPVLRHERRAHRGLRAASATRRAPTALP